MATAEELLKIVGSPVDSDAVRARVAADGLVASAEPDLEEGGPRTVAPEGLQYATVHKTRENNRVVQVEARVVYGTAEGVRRALERSSASPSVNTSFVERHNGTDRRRNARKGRKT
jgi:hypothetical protein